MARDWRIFRSWVVCLTLCVGITLVDVEAQGPFSAQIQAALRAFLTQAHTWTGVQTFSGGASYSGQVLLPDGSVGTPALAFTTNPTTGVSNFSGQAGVFGISSSGVAVAKFSNNASVGVSVDGALGLGFSSDIVNVAPDVRLFRGGANILDLRNATNAQTFNIYNTYTDAANFEKGMAFWSGNVFVIGPSQAGTGSVRSLGLQTGGTTQWLVNTSGNFVDQGTHTITAGGAVTGGTLVSTGKLTSYNGATTAGWGASVIQAAGRVTAQTAAAAAFSTYTVGAADGSFEISANVNVTASTTHSFTVTCTYTDEGNTARTFTMGFSQLSGAVLAATITNVTGAGPYESPIYHIRAKASTAITFATTGTFTSVTYNAEGIIKQTA